MSAWRVSSTQNVERALLFMLCLAAGDVGRCEAPDARLELASVRQWLTLECGSQAMFNATLKHVSSTGRSGGRGVEHSMSCLDAATRGGDRLPAGLV